MAELQTSSYSSKAKPSQVLDVKAVQHKTRDVYQGAGDEKFAEAKVWEAAQQFTDKALAQATRQITEQADQARADEIIDDIRNEAIENFEYIENEIGKLPASEIRPDKWMEEFENNKLKGFKIKNIEEYEGYEGLNSKFKKQVTDQFKSAKEDTKQSLLRKLAKLSNQHTLGKFNKMALDSQSQVASILNDPKNIVVNVEPKDYVKEWDKPGLDQGPMNSKQYSQYMKYQLSQGGMAIPGRLERGKPEDLGVEGGLTEDAKKKLDQVLNNFSDRVFDAKKRNVVSMADVEKIHSTLLKGVLQQHFLSQYEADPHTAIEKAKKGEYRYKKDFTGFSGEKEQIDYVLSPDFTHQYIQSYNAKMAKPPVADPYAVMDLSEKIINEARKGKPMTTGAIKNLALNIPGIKGDPKAITRLMEMGLKLYNKEEDDEVIADHGDIVNFIDKDINLNPDNINKYFNEQPDGNWKLKPPEELAEVVPDKIIWERHTEWRYGDNGHEYLEEPKKVVTKGKHRQGSHLLNDLDFAATINKYQSSYKKFVQDDYVKSQTNRLGQPVGAREFLDEVTDEDNYPFQLDDNKVSKLYNSKSPEGEILRLTYATEEEAKSALRGLIPIAKRTLQSKPNKKWLRGESANDEAFFAALKEQHKVDIQNMRNIGANVNPADIEKASLAINPIDMFEQKMKEENNGKGLTDQQQEWLEFYTVAQGKLQNIQKDLKVFDLNQIKAYIVEFAGTADNRTQSIKYFMNWELSNVIEAQLKQRHSILMSKEDAKKAIQEEGSNPYWVKKFPLTDHDPKTVEIKRAGLIADYLGLPRAGVDIFDASGNNSSLTNVAKPGPAKREDITKTSEELEKHQQLLNSKMAIQNGLRGGSSE